MRTLAGLRVVVTRAAHQAEELARPLRERGAKVILLPVIGIAQPADLQPLRQAASHCDEYDWIIFTSANAITAFVHELRCPPGDCKSRVATVGAATREVAEQIGFRVSLTPPSYVAESLVEAFCDHKLKDQRILVPSAAVTRDVVATVLRKRGAQVDLVEAYRNVIPPQAAEEALLVFQKPYPEWVTFASSSAVENLIRLIGIEPLQGIKVATIGPITSQTVRAHGLIIAAEASVSTIISLVEAICAAHAGGAGSPDGGGSE